MVLTLSGLFIMPELFSFRKGCLKIVDVHKLNCLLNSIHDVVNQFFHELGQ